jgi:hypothetical protein
MNAKFVVLGAAGAARALASPHQRQQAAKRRCSLGPIHAYGTWNRCFQSTPQTTFGRFGQATGYVPAVWHCYPVDPNASPPTPLGQLPYHIDP